MKSKSELTYVAVVVPASLTLHGGRPADNVKVKAVATSTLLKYVDSGEEIDESLLQCSEIPVQITSAACRSVWT